MDSILTTIKKMLGIADEYEHFDPELITHINSALMILTQIGVGPKEGFSIDDKNSKWSDFVENIDKIQAVKSYVYYRVKLAFDSNSSSSMVIESLNNMIKELEFRLNVAVDTDHKDGVNH